MKEGDFPLSKKDLLNLHYIIFQDNNKIFTTKIYNLI